MTIDVIQWATGTVGIHAVPAIVAHPGLNLAGLWVHSADKVGRDAGEICGIDPVGVNATNDRDALLYDSNAPVISYMANSDLRPGEVIDDLCAMLAAGKNVVNTSYVPLLLPRIAGPGVAERLEAACAEGGSTLYTSGIDPGYGNVVVATGALGLCTRVDQVRMTEIIDYSTWDNPFTLFDIMGFAKEHTSESILLAPGSTALAWGPVVTLVADALRIELDGLVEHHEIIRADEDFQIASGTVPKGTISGMHFEVHGMLDSEPVVILEHVTRLRADDAPGWPQGSGYRIQITGEPSVKTEVSLSSDNGDHNHAGCLATAMWVLNAIPDVVAAEPGIVTDLDLPAVRGGVKGLFHR